eukprot:9411840-Pyramimonas_sp.AAC.1
MELVRSFARDPHSDVALTFKRTSFGRSLAISFGGGAGVGAEPVRSFALDPRSDAAKTSKRPRAVDRCVADFGGRPGCLGVPGSAH